LSEARDALTANYMHVYTGEAASAKAFTSVDYASRDLSPAHRNNNARRVCVLRDMLEHASVQQKAEVRSSFLSLSVWLPALLKRSTQYCFCFLSLLSMISTQIVKMHCIHLCTLRACPISHVLTKHQLIEYGCLHLLVSFLGVHIARALVVAISSACRSETGSRCAVYCAALAGLASPQEQSVNAMIVRIVPHVVNLLVSGTENGKQEAAGGRVHFLLLILMLKWQSQRRVHLHHL